jgi:riboflavin-specific deaminase-like protein
MRAFHDAVLVGVDTVIADNPKLTVRDAPGETPLRIILDSNLRTPASAALFDDAAQNPVLIAHVCEADERIQRQFSMSGVALLRTAADENGRVQLPELLTELGHRGVLSVMVEGGAKIHGAFITTGTANAFALFVSPKIIGRGIPWASFPGVCNISDAVCATELKTLPIGKDILLTGQF